jgi:isoleucyl-tRNA synthetase
VLAARGPVAALVDAHRSELPMLFIVSDVAVDAGPAEGADEVRVSVERAPGVKCERCWRYVPSVSREPDWAGICSRCIDALGGTGQSLT